VLLIQSAFFLRAQQAGVLLPVAGKEWRPIVKCNKIATTS